MRTLYILIMATCLSVVSLAQENYEQGKPGDNRYRYLDEYQGLKNYINYEKYPNFKLGIGTTVSDYLKKGIVYKLTNANFTETVAGNAMKMGSCVDGNGNMNFTTVRSYVNTATNAGLNVYGHTLAWHSQQPKGWLLTLLADKPNPSGETEYTVVADKDFRTLQTIGWHSDESTYGYHVSFDNSNGLKVTTTVSKSWEVQLIPMDNILLESGKTYKMTFTVRGSKSGKLDGRLGDWNASGGAAFSINFTSSWQDVSVNIKPTMNANFILVHVPNYVGDIFVKDIKFEGEKTKTVPQTAQEMHDTLVYAMDKWIKGMMTACNGKVKAWDLVNEAISGGGNDGTGHYLLQHSKEYDPSGNPDASWDVGGDAFFWQDYMGDLDYVRQACRLARQYGPEDVKLFINDYNLEGTWDLLTRDGITASKKLWSLINWIKKWENDGVTHIDGIGTQMHISYSDNTSAQNSLKTAITGMFKLMAKSGKLVRVSELDMGYNNASGASVPTGSMTEAQHKRMASFYQWILQQYFTLIPPEQQWGICHWCPTDSPSDSGWRANTPVGIWDLDYYRKHVYAGFVLGLYGGTAPTGINEVQSSIDNGQMANDNQWYDLSGRKLSKKPASGYYIQGGKTYLAQ